ncbi:peptidase [Curtobacterium sp. MCBD17_021]|uniref:peptidase n=1 Tax=Curtobacterium sp. MCBD17_021 TaxID=2175665 RepID=UPI000DA76A83|nr:peptidase [Curtobacterium sp. MCBD17_021]PZE66393.1 peptidase [Curtobacterium sp. MCBD17_021]
MRSAIVLTTAAVIACTLGAVTPASASTDQDGGVGVRLVPDGSRTTSAQDRAYLIANPDVGGTVRRTVEVSNTSRDVQVVTLYPGAATIRDGAFVGEAAEATNDLARWTSLAKTEIVLSPDETERVDAEIAVPRSAASGERYGAIWAAVQATSPSGSVDTVNRAGIRMYVNVGNGSARPAFEIEDLAAADHDGATGVIATVRNTGSVAVDLTGQLRLVKGGLTAGPFNTSSATTIAPGDTSTVVFTVDPDLPGGGWHATAALSSGTSSRTASATVVLPVRAVAAPAPSPIAVAAAAAGVTAALALLVTLLVRRRRTGGTPGQGARASVVADARPHT